jgi:UDP-glucuronate 4-epimerase
MKRDFTYVDDLVEGIRLLIDAAPRRPEDGLVPEGDSLSPVAPFRVVNIGNSEPVALLDFIRAIEAATGRTAELNLMPMQPGDVPDTYADITAIAADHGFAPTTSIDAGVPDFVRWYRGWTGA